MNDGGTRAAGRGRDKKCTLKKFKFTFFLKKKPHEWENGMHIILKTWDEEERQVENVGTLTKFVQVIFF